MSKIRTIQCNVGNATLVWKYPFPRIIRGSVITVHQNQIACIYANGSRVYILEPGRNVVVDSAQLPYLDNALNVGTGGQTTYSFEIWYANMSCEHNVNWSIDGEHDGVYIHDCSIGVPMKLNACGQYRFKICNAGLLMDKLVGTQTQYVITQVLKFLEIQIKSIIVDIVMNVATEKQYTIQQILTQRRELNAILQLAINKEVKQMYGLEITDFSIGQLNSSDYDSYLRHQQNGLGKRVELSAQGEYYQQERNYQLLNNAVSNQGNCNMIGVGVGLGVGNTIGQQVGAIASQTLIGHSVPPPIIEEDIWHYAVNNLPSPPMPESQIKEMIAKNIITATTKVWKPGMKTWTPAAQVPELANQFMPPL